MADILIFALFFMVLDLRLTKKDWDSAEPLFFCPYIKSSKTFKTV